jgi:polyisoprenoid-binding protein YceI
MRTAKGTISVFTFKDGILARAAHDLALRMDQFQVTLDGDRVTAVMPLEGLDVLGPVEGGVVQADRYDAAQRAEVERTMHTDVLHSARYPMARYTGRAIAEGAGFHVDGQLELAGRTTTLSFDVRRDGDVYRARFELSPSRWGIQPYKALLGAIKLKDSVRIELALTENAPDVRA